MKNFSTSFNLLAKLINQVIIISNKLFHFFMKFWMLQERKLCICGIFGKWQFPIFWIFFSRNHFLEGGFIFQWGEGGLFFSFFFGEGGERGCPKGGGAWVLMGVFKKNHGMVAPPLSYASHIRGNPDYKTKYWLQSLDS